MISLKGKVSIVTGGSRGIGAATALLLARAGSDVVVNYLNNKPKAAEVESKIRELGGRAILHRGDVGEAAVAKELVERATEEFGRIDVVVNNAGIWTHAEIGAASGEVWDETLQANLKSVFNVCNAVVPQLKKTRGRIVNISSTAGQRGEAFHSHYAASKGGILALTKSLAVELAPFGILVNAVAPGWVETEMNAEVFAERAFREQVVESIPLKKIATAEDVAGAVLFLASDLAGHITGATINVNGGSVLN
jgi:3-oxoacyl-[acyl-carrier protein] reductase